MDEKITNIQNTVTIPRFEYDQLIRTAQKYSCSISRLRDDAMKSAEACYESKLRDLKDKINKLKQEIADLKLAAYKRSFVTKTIIYTISAVIATVIGLSLIGI